MYIYIYMLNIIITMLYIYIYIYIYLGLVHAALVLHDLHERREDVLRERNVRERVCQSQNITGAGNCFVKLSRLNF